MKRAKNTYWTSFTTVTPTNMLFATLILPFANRIAIVSAYIAAVTIMSTAEQMVKKLIELATTVCVLINPVVNSCATMSVNGIVPHSMWNISSLDNGSLLISPIFSFI